MNDDDENIGAAKKLDEWIIQEGKHGESVVEALSRHAEIVLAQRGLKQHLDRQQKSTWGKAWDMHLLMSALVVRALTRGALPPAATPPSTFLLDLLMKPADALDARINLEEAFTLWTVRHGSRRAAWIFRVQTGSVLVGYWFGKALGLAERVVKNFSVFFRPSGS